ncbi:MAG TPA: MSMEG_0569 family flavin-dependent oxidoreductase [Candidatus Acidoferrum sp.]|nr:MSMEG_0569 family flavin-dependent oxidoreductase [Candidatus Acidoferrum sp.]
MNGGRIPVAVIGGGQAGLSISALLKERGVEHVVLEKHRVAHTWRTERWDSFCLVTPNWQCRLPGFPYGGDDPEGFMLKDEIVRYIEAFAASFDPPLHEGVAVTGLRRAASGEGFHLTTSAGELTADQVVVAIGGYHTASLPRIAERIPADLMHVHSSAYRNPQALPAGAVLVVGSGQSGAQIAEDLHLAGRRVQLCVGRAPRTARRYRGRDVVAWLDAMGYYDLAVEDHPLREGVRDNTNHYVTGRDGGRDIDLRKFALEGMQLHGRLIDVAGSTLRFADDLEENLDRADAVAEKIKTSIDRYIEEHRIDAPLEPRYTPVWKPEHPSRELDLHEAGIAAIVWCVGFRSDYRWIDVPIFDGKGYPSHHRGVTTAPGLYFLGLPWQHTWGSGRFSGIARDAAYLADRIEEHIPAGAAR